MSAMISRDPFAREELHRDVVRDPHETCKWCGNVRTTPTGKRYLYSYSVERDCCNGRADVIPGLFCSVGCLRDYSR